MNELLEAVPRWAKIVGGIVTIGGLVVGGVGWALAVDEAKDTVPIIERRVDRVEIDKALLECQIKEIPPVDCEMPRADE